jgi:hypothetical protein
MNSAKKYFSISIVLLFSFLNIMLLAGFNYRIVSHWIFALFVYAVICIVFSGIGYVISIVIKRKLINFESMSPNKKIFFIAFQIVAFLVFMMNFILVLAPFLEHFFRGI